MTKNYSTTGQMLPPTDNNIFSFGVLDRTPSPMKTILRLVDARHL